MSAKGCLSSLPVRSDYKDLTRTLTKPDRHMLPFSKGDFCIENETTVSALSNSRLANVD